MEKIQTIKIIIGLILAILLIDFMGMLCWIYSGQQPIDNFYIGTISTNIIRFFYKSDNFNGRNYIQYEQFDPKTGNKIKQ